VHRLLRQAFGRSRHFTWDDDRVTFAPAFSKQATVLGACYAELLRQLHFAPATIKHELRTGLNQFVFKIENLFYFLPCSFLLKAISRPITIFEYGRRLLRLDDEEAGKARSVPQGVALEIAVQREAYPNAAAIPWVSYDMVALARQLGQSENEFKNQVQMQFEVNHRQEISLYLWKKRPHYRVAATDRFAALEVAAAPPQPQGPAEPTLEEGPPRVPWSLSLDARLRRLNGHKPTVLWEAGQPLDEAFHLTGAVGEGGGAVRRGLIARDVTLFDEQGCVHVFVQHPGREEWEPVGVLRRRDLPAGDEAASQGYRADFPVCYSLSVDDRGVVRLHLGEVPYWTTHDPLFWKDHEGSVLVCTPDSPRPDQDLLLDPYSGVH
jgi:hypothetical protein